MFVLFTSHPHHPHPQITHSTLLWFSLFLLTQRSDSLRAKIDRCILGTLRLESADGKENVAEKVNLPSFILHRDYSKSLSNFVKRRRTLLKLNS